MPEPSSFDSNRREFLTGRTLQKEVERTGSAMADELVKELSREPPVGGNTVRLSTEAMACDFSVVLNQGASGHLMTAADALEIIHRLEAQMTVYKDDSELSRLNKSAFGQSVPVEPQLFELLLKTKELWQETAGAFDPTSGPLIALWRRFRHEGRIPHAAEIAEALTHTGMRHIRFDETTCSIGFDDPLSEFNLGAIGKGYALDRAAVILKEAGIEDWLFHGGFSSILAQGAASRARRLAGGDSQSTYCRTKPWAQFCSKTGPCPPAAPAYNPFESAEKDTGTSSIRARAGRWRNSYR